MADQSIVKILNTGTTDHTDWYNGTQYTIPAGQEVLLPYDLMCLWLGHPKANNFNPQNRVRVMEYERLRLKYGIEARALEMAKDGVPVEPDSLWDKMRPSLEVHDIEGNVIFTVADDPDGTTLRPLEEEATGENQIALILSELQEQKRRTQILESELAQRRRTDSALMDAAPIGEDESPIPPTRSDIVGTVELDPEHPEAPKVKPRGKARTEVGEDTPERVRVSGG